MTVDNLGYIKFDKIIEMLLHNEHFCIYSTPKKTHILIKGVDDEKVSLFYPKQDRIEWKNVEGKKITTGVKVFDSKIDKVTAVDVSKWNNGNQIMSYKPFIM